MADNGPYDKWPTMHGLWQTNGCQWPQGLASMIRERDVFRDLLLEAVRQDFGTPGWRARAIKAGVVR